MECLKTIYGITGEHLKEHHSHTLTIASNNINTIKDESKLNEEAEVYKTRGNEALAAKRYHEALTAYTEAIRLNPNNAVYWANRAAVQAALESHEEALEDAKQAIGINPGYAKGHGRKGAALYALERFDEAVEAYEEALLAEPANANTKSALELARSKASLKTNDNPTSPMSETMSTGMPNLGGFDLSKLASNPQLMKMASDLASNDKLRDLMNSPMAQQLMQNFMKGAGGSRGPPPGTA